LAEAGEAQVVMMYQNVIPQNLAGHEPLDQGARRSGVLDGMLLGLVLITLVRTNEAAASDQLSADELRRLIPTSSAPAVHPDFFKIPALADIHVYSATDFQPRKHTVFDSEPLVNSFNDAPMLHGTTVWQRMSDYKSHDGVRLLTLWHAQSGSVSLQTGKHGDPWLQWSSGLGRRGDATRGLFDQLFSVSVARASNSLRGPARAAISPVPSTQMPAAAVSALK
jgi:hypothetical protein